MRTSPRAPSRTSFSSPQRLRRGSGSPLVLRLHTLQRSAPDAGGPRTRVSEVHWVPGRTEVRRNVLEAEPPPRRPSLHREAGSTRRTVRKRCGVADSLEEDRVLAQAPPPPRDSVRLEAGPRREPDAGTGPRRLG